MFRSFRKNRKFSNILTKIEFFRKFDSQISLISKVFVIFENFDQNRIFFENLSKVEIFPKFDQNRNFSKEFKFFRKFEQSPNLSKIFTQIEIFKIIEIFL